MTGAPVPLKEMAPIQACSDEFAPLMGSGLKVSPVSGAAVLNSGASNLRKPVKGVASSPGGGLIAARLRLYSGTRINTLRRKLVRVAAAGRSPLLDAASTARACSRTASGHAEERATILATDDLSVSASPRFAAAR